MKATVIGCGRWGSFIAWYLRKIGHEVTLYGREGSKHIEQFRQTRTNGLVTLEDNVRITTDLLEALQSDLICISIRSQNLSDLMHQIAAQNVKGKTFALCMKGIEVKERLISWLSGGLIRFYYGTDLIGNEVGAAAKNVIGIAAGMLDGMGLSSLKGALMSRGTREVSRLIAAMGGNGFSAYGLCHLGDYEATVFSQYSHNRRFGELFVRGEPYTELAEGYDTVKALCALAERYDVDLPICRAVYAVLYDGAQPKEQMNLLFTRSLKREFDG